MTLGSGIGGDDGDFDLRRVISALVERCDQLAEEIEALRAENDVARQSGSEGPSIRIRIRDRVVAIVFLMIDAGKRYV